jgi:DNA-directed RNA polymerase specialized sigma24 family protein
MDSGELERLVERHRKALRLLAATICTNPDDAVQQSFMKLATLDSKPANPAAWLYRVVKNEAISQFRSETRRGRYERKAAVDDLPGETFRR